MRIIFSGLLLVFLFSSYIAQAQSPQFRNYSIDQGLPSSECYQLLQDKQHYIWIVSDRGVARYDGYKFKRYTSRNGLPENTVFRMHKDYKERIWFVCASNEMAVYENGKMRCLPASINRQLKSKLNGAVINTIASYKDTIYLAYTNSNHAFKLVVGASGMKLLPYQKQIQNNAFIEILPNKQTSAGWKLNMVKPIANGICRIWSKETKQSVQLLLNSKLGRWFRTYLFENKLYLIHGNVVYIQPLNNQPLQKVDFPSKVIHLKWKLGRNDNRFWVATTDGLYCFSDLRMKGKPNIYLKGRGVTDVIRDHEGSYWVTTLNRGLYYNKSMKIQNYHIDGRIFSCAVHKGDLLLGMENGQLGRRNGTDLQVKKIDDNKQGIPIYKIVVGKNDELHIRGYAYLIYSQRKKHIIYVQDEYTAKEFYYDSITGKSWLALASRIAEGKDTRLKTSHKLNKQGIFSTIIRTPNGEVVVGGKNGLYFFSEGNQKLRPFVKKIPNVTCLAHQSGVVWAGSKEDGLVIKKNQDTYRLNDAFGFKPEYCNYIFADKPDRAWVATNKGIARVVVTSWKPFNYTCQYLSKKEGLISDEILQICACKGKIIAVGTGGYSEFYPNILSAKESRQRVLITGVSANNKSLANSRITHLTEPGSGLKINFTCLSFKRDKNIRYRYRMKGVDRKWKYNRYTFAEYTNLPSGKLEFEVQAESSFGNWNTPVSRIIFYSPVPFLERWLVRLGLVILMGLLVWLVVRWRVQRVKRIAAERESLFKKASEMELKFLTGQMNPHFTFNAMNSIQHFMLNNDLMKAQSYLTKYSKLIRRVMENNMRDFVSLSSEIELLQLYVDIESSRFSKPIQLEVICSEELRSTVGIPPMFIQPYIENAIWHGLFDDRIQNARILLQFSQEGAFIKCVVEDNGIGRSAAIKNSEKKGHQSLGMLITHKRLDAVGQQQYKEPEITDLKDEAGIATGTRVVVYLPFRDK